MEIKRLGLTELKLAPSDAEAMTFAGYGAVFGNVDSYGDVIKVGAFADTLREAKASGQWPAMLLQQIVPGLRKKAVREALRAGGKVVRDEARSAAPVLRAVRRGTPRTPGLVRKAISVRAAKMPRRSGAVGVTVGVQPAKPAHRGARSALDPFYWRFLEFGTKKMRARPFLRAGAKKLDAALEAFKKVLGPAIEKLNRTKAP